jgi:hypothetical protein
MTLSNVGGTDGNKAGSCLPHEEGNTAPSGSGNCPTGRDFNYAYEVVNAGTITSLWAEAETAPGGAANTNITTISVLKNGIAVMSCTITGTTQFACETTGTVAVTTGDFIAVKVDETTGNAADSHWKSYVTIGTG